MSGNPDETRWRGPTIAEIAQTSGVGTATVDRVLNKRGRVRDATRKKVMEALRSLGGVQRSEPPPAPRRHRIAVLTESGATFNRMLLEAVDLYAAAHPDVECTTTAVPSQEADPVATAQLIERAARNADGLVLVAREHLMINRAVRAVTERGVPVVCVTTDLPSSNRLAYVGSDQAAAGATAAYLMGRFVGARSGKLLLGVSAAYRAQEERELGFRRVIRAEFAHLKVDERVNSNDHSDYSYESVRKYIADNGPPIGIYNVAGGNVGMARAISDAGLQGQVVFIGHELHGNTRALLESGSMDFVIGHDITDEIATSFQTIRAHLCKLPFVPPPLAKVRLYSKYNCN